MILTPLTNPPYKLKPQNSDETDALFSASVALRGMLDYENKRPTEINISYGAISITLTREEVEKMADCLELMGASDKFEVIMRARYPEYNDEEENENDF